MTKAMNPAAIEKATGISWPDWLTYFDSIKAKDLPHSEIATLAQAFIKDTGIFEDKPVSSPGWWAQNVTVAYEQHIGRRIPGQRSDGTYEVAVSKTLSGSMDEALEWWLYKVQGVTEFSGIALISEPAISKTEKWRHWRVNLADGTRIGMSTTNQADDKALLTVTSNKLTSTEAVETWRAFWKRFL